MKEQFRIDRINKMIMRLGLHRPIVSRSHMKQHLDKIFTKKPARQKAGKYISMLNSRGTYPSNIRNSFTEGEIKYYRQKLHRYNLHTIVSEFEDLKPIQTLQWINPSPCVFSPLWTCISFQGIHGYYHGETAIETLLNAIRINLMIHFAFDYWRLLLLG